MGMMFAWATPNYLLDYMSIEEVFYYYDKGLQFEEFRAKLRAGWIGELFNEKKGSTPPRSDKPDKKKFNQIYGDQIERG